MRQTYLALWIQPLPEKVLDLAHFLPKVHRICIYIYTVYIYICNYVYVYIYTHTIYIYSMWRFPEMRLPPMTMEISHLFAATTWRPTKA